MCTVRCSEDAVLGEKESSPYHVLHDRDDGV